MDQTTEASGAPKSVWRCGDNQHIFTIKVGWIVPMSGSYLGTSIDIHIKPVGLKMLKSTRVIFNGLCFV